MIQRTLTTAAALMLAHLHTPHGFAGTPTGPIFIDGYVDEWSGVAAANDPAGDHSGRHDVTELRAVPAGTALYLSFDDLGTSNLQSGNGIGLSIEIGMPSVARTLTIDLDRRWPYTDGQLVNRIPWDQIDFALLPTYASTRYELRVELASFGVQPGDGVTVDFSGSDAMPAPLAVTLGGSPPVPPRTSTNRPVSAHLRLVSLNTLSNGLTDAGQRDAIARLLAAVPADVLCLQEEYGQTAAAVTQRLEEIDPRADARPWNVHLNNDCVIASPFPVLPVPEFDSSYAAAVVEHPLGSVLILSIHPKCCGNANSSEDLTRISQTLDMINTIGTLRAVDDPSNPLFPHRDAPAIVVGDYNLVGSSAPLDLLTNPDGPALLPAPLPVLHATDATTWRTLSGFGFAPGRLDLCVHDPRLVRVQGFALDAALLPQHQLAALGLLDADSTASDHRLLTQDFALTHPADLTTTGSAPGQPAHLVPDAEVNLSDLQTYLTLWSSHDPRADLATTGAPAGTQTDPLRNAPDDELNLTDLFRYLTLWNEGFTN